MCIFFVFFCLFACLLDAGPILLEIVLALSGAGIILFEIVLTVPNAGFVLLDHILDSLDAEPL